MVKFLHSDLGARAKKWLTKCAHIVSDGPKKLLATLSDQKATNGLSDIEESGFNNQLESSDKDSR